MERTKISINDLHAKKRERAKIAMLTAYDYPTAKIIDDAGIDAILVGDSLGMVVLGYDSTVPVTMDEMIHHAKAVRRGTRYALLIGDMPFMSYHISAEETVRNAGRFMKEAGCDAVKLEGGEGALEAVRLIVRAGIPVLGHIGLTPQTVSKLGGYKVQGKDAESAKRLLSQAHGLQGQGCFALVLECLPDEVARLITGELTIPTISCGAGPGCDGQILVTNDIIGMYDRFVPKFAKQYARIAPIISDGVKRYKDEVERGVFPAKENTYFMKDEELKRLKE